MSERVPEELTDYPDSGESRCDDNTMESREFLALGGENLRELPDAPPPMVVEAASPDEAESTGEETNRVARGPAAHFAWGLCVALTALVLLFIATEIHAFIRASFALHPFYGWVGAGFLGLVGVLIGAILASEWRKYLSLKSVVRMRENYAQLMKERRDHNLNRTVREEVRAYRDRLERSSTVISRKNFHRLRERMQDVDDALQWKEHLDRLMLQPLDREVQRVIRREAANVGVGTAISPTGAIDAVIALWRNVKLIKRIASIYVGRPGFYGTLVIIRRTVGAVALANLLDELTAEILAASFLSRLTGAGAQGLANATMTIRVGLKAQEQCRPIPLAPEDRTGSARSLAGTVWDSMKSVIRRKAESPRKNKEKAR
jgi:putative membrane protein